MTSNRQLSLFPESGDDLRSALHGFQAAAGVTLYFVDRLGAQAGQLALLGVAKQVLDRIELGRVTGQALQHDLVVERFDVVANGAASMRGKSVPDDRQLRADLRFERLEELDQLWALDRTTKEPEVETPERDPGDQRERVPVEAVLNRRRAAFWRPGPDSRGAFAQSKFVDEDDGSSLSSGLFFAQASVWFSIRESLPRRAGSRDPSDAGC